MRALANRTARSLLGAACVASGWRRRCVDRFGGEGRVLCAFSHNPTLAVMEAVIGWLQGNGFHFVSQHDLLAALRGGNRLPSRSVWLSFDDCWRDNLLNVVPVLERAAIPATFFVAPCATELGAVWTDVVMHDGPMRRELLAMPNAARQERIRQLLASGRDAPRRLMTAEEIGRLSRNPLLSFENHTLTHAAATACTPGELLEEVRLADRQIAAWTGRKTRMVCYPFGRWSAAGDAALAQEGWVTVSSDPGCLTIGTEGGTVRLLPRNLFYDDRSLTENSCRLVGAWKRIRTDSHG